MKKHLLLIIAVLLTGIVKAQETPPSTNLYSTSQAQFSEHLPDSAVWIYKGQSPSGTPFGWARLARYSDLISGYVPTNFLRINGSNANTDVNIYNNLYKSTKGFLMDTVISGKQRYFNLSTSSLYSTFQNSPSGTIGTYYFQDYNGVNNQAYGINNNVEISVNQSIGSNAKFKFHENSTGHEKGLLIDSTSSIQVFDDVTNKGMIYAADYSANFTDRSLVDKGYVTSSLSGYLPLTAGSGSPLTGALNWFESGALRGSIEATSTSLILNSITGNDIRFQTDGATKVSISNAGNLSVIGSTTATALIKSGGLPTQFLMADGSTTTTSNYIQNQQASAQPANMWIDGDIYSRSISTAANGAGYTAFLQNTSSAGAGALIEGGNTKATSSGGAYALRVDDYAFNPLLKVYSDEIDITPTVNIASLTASQLVATDASKNIVSLTALPSVTTATTQSAGDNSTKVATTAYVDGALASGAPPKYNLSTTTDANYTITGVSDGVGQVVKLVTITASRTVSLPTASSFTGQQIIFFNYDTSGTNVWTISSGNAISGPSGGTTTSLGVAGFVTKMISDGANWVVY